jgi:hypothetical protein
MIIFFENFNQREQHFDQRYTERVQDLNLSRRQYEILDQNFKTLDRYKTHIGKKTLAMRLLRFSTDENFEYKDRAGAEFVGNEIWAIAEEGNLVTVIIRSSKDTKDKHAAKKMFKTNFIAYGERDLTNIVNYKKKKTNQSVNTR